MNAFGAFGKYNNGYGNGNGNAFALVAKGGSFWKENKGLVLTVLMFVVLALFGVPYMHSDVASSKPAMYIVSMTALLFTLLGALFVYVFNMSVDSYLALVSVVIILMTLFGQSKHSATDVELPPIIKEYLVLALIAGCLYASSKLAGKWSPANPTVQMLVVYYRDLVPLALGGITIYAIYRGIRDLLDSYKSKTPCKDPKVRTYEAFQNGELIDRLENAIERAQTNLETLVELTDSTCAIIREVEQGYVGARSAPVDDAEYALPAEEQQERRTARQARAAKSFLANRKLHAASQNVPILECFQAADVDDDELRELCVKLHSVLENSEALLQIRKLQSMEIELEYADRVLRKVEEFQDASAEPKSPTQVYAAMDGAELRAAAERLLKKELQLHNDIVQVQNKLQELRGKLGGVYQKANMVSKGDYNMNSTQNKEAAERLNTTGLQGA